MPHHPHDPLPGPPSQTGADMPRMSLAPGLETSRIVTGLWQMADQERGGAGPDLDAAADALAAYARAGFTGWDMADHYGSAEIVAGRARALLAAEGGPAPMIATKWCPEPGPMTPETVRAGVERALRRLKTDHIPLLQLHWWRYEHPGYLDAAAELMRLRAAGLMGELGVTNVDAAHLRVLVKNGVALRTNQVSFSLIDRRADGPLAAACAALGVRLLAYGTLCGGFLSERWLGAAPPAPEDWSKMKYLRFIDAAGGWGPFQAVLRAANAVARRHAVSIANVATRWVLDRPHVAAVIVGARLTERDHRTDNLRALGFAFDDTDRATLNTALEGLLPIPGDCGDEYRRPPFLTASGDLSHHLDEVPKIYAGAAVPGRPARARVDTGTEWEAAAGFSRAIRTGRRILVSGTTATDDHGQVVCPGDPAGQTTFILDKIAASLEALGGSLSDVVRTRIYMAETERWEEVARAHGAALGEVRPANTLIRAAAVGPYEVEIEAEAELDAP